MKAINKISIVLLTLFAANSAYSQTGPGGVGNSTNNVLWLNSDIVTFSTSPDIGTWPDQSGNGNDLTQATSSLQPRRVNYSSHKSVRFDNEYMQRAGIAALNTNTITQYFVFEGSRADHDGVVLDASFTESTQFLRTYRNGGNIRSWVLNSVGGIEDNTAAVSSSFQIVSSVWDGAGTQTFDSYVDGASIGSNGGANGSPSGSSFITLGAQKNGSKKFDGDMGEIIMYSTVLNSAQRVIVDNYLGAKYGITVDSDFYAYESGHNEDVIGIGQEADGGNLTAQGASIMELSIGSLSNGDYVITGHDGVDLSTTTNDVPVAIAGGSRLSRVWRSDLTGTPGAVDIVFDVSSLTLPAGSYWVVVESVNGVFNDGGTVEYGPFTDVGGLVTASGVTLADGDYFTVASGTASEIASIKTGNWTDVTTWSCNCVPVLTDDITITAGHTVTVDASAAVNDIVINGNLTSVTISTFDIHGDYTIGATGTVAHKKIYFKGSSLQSLTNSSGTDADLRTLVVDNASNVRVVSGGFQITNSAVITTGQLQNVGGTFTFVSNATSTGVILNSSGSGFTGSYVFERYISARNASYGDFSSPVADLTLGQWDTDETGSVTEMVMSHVGGIDGDAGDFYSVWDFNEATQAYDSIIDTSYVLPLGMGIEIWMQDAATWDAKTLDTRGTPNFGDVAVSVSTDWNLVGNPYQNWIRWTKLTKPTLNSTYYIWNTSTASYDAKTAGTIPPSQGFWVESTSAGTLTFTESSKTNSGSSTFWKIGEPLNEDEEPIEFAESLLKIKSNNYSYSHVLKLRLNNLATTEYDYFDASFKESRIAEAPSITSFSSNSNKELAINSFNYDDEVVIPIMVSVGISGEHIIEPINFESFQHDFEVIELKDNKTGKVYNLKGYTKSKILFDINKGDNTERFTLTLSNLKKGDISYENVDVYRSNYNTVIELVEKDVNINSIHVHNVLGQEIMTLNNVNDSRVELSNSSLSRGLNIITIETDQEVFVKKIKY